MGIGVDEWMDDEKRGEAGGDEIREGMKMIIRNLMSKNSFFDFGFGD